MTKLYAAHVNHRLSVLTEQRDQARAELAEMQGDAADCGECGGGRGHHPSWCATGELLQLEEQARVLRTAIGKGSRNFGPAARRFIACLSPVRDMLEHTLRNDAACGDDDLRVERGDFYDKPLGVAESDPNFIALMKGCDHVNVETLPADDGGEVHHCHGCGSVIYTPPEEDGGVAAAVGFLSGSLGTKGSSS